MAIGAKSRTAIDNAIRERKEFHIASISGITLQKGIKDPTYGELPQGFVAMLNHDRERYNLYVVHSYSTPIAWVPISELHKFPDELANAWTIPDTYYSRTTSGHQGLIQTITTTSLEKSPFR